MPSIFNNDFTYYAAMATKINTPQIFLPTKNTKILPTKFNMHTVAVNLHAAIKQKSRAYLHVFKQNLANSAN